VQLPERRCGILLTADKWAAGPTAVALRQQGPWTAGMLANHLWSFAGDDDRADIKRTFLQPFVSYTTPTACTYSLHTESLHDRETSEWQVPIRASVSRIVRLGKLPVSIGGSVHYWDGSPANGAEGWGARVTFTLLLPPVTNRNVAECPSPAAAPAAGAFCLVAA
jgi:hypothetical protein